MRPFQLILGYDYHLWHSFAQKQAIYMTISHKKNNHCLIVGSSGSGKSYALLLMLARMYHSDNSLRTYFCDFKREDDYEFMASCPYYYAYNHVLDGIEEVYNIMHQRQSGKDKSRSPVLLIIDEYVVFILYLTGQDKKRADAVKSKISELLMLARSLNIKVWLGCQRPDASVFSNGARLNFGTTIVLGSGNNSLYDMVLSKEEISQTTDKTFKTGEGVIVQQGLPMRFLKVPKIEEIEQIHKTCIDALS